MGERVVGSLQAVSDIASIDIMRGREAAVKPYVEYRKWCKLPVPNDFKDLLEWMPAEVRFKSLSYPINTFKVDRSKRKRIYDLVSRSMRVERRERVTSGTLLV